ENGKNFQSGVRNLQSKSHSSAIQNRLKDTQSAIRNRQSTIGNPKLLQRLPQLGNELGLVVHGAHPGHSHHDRIHIRGFRLLTGLSYAAICHVSASESDPLRGSCDRLEIVPLLPADVFLPSSEREVEVAALRGQVTVPATPVRQSERAPYLDPFGCAFAGLEYHFLDNGINTHGIAGMCGDRRTCRKYQHQSE